MALKKIRRYFIVWSINAKARLMERMAYPINFFIMTIAVVVQMILPVILISVIFRFSGNLSGWSRDQAMIVLSAYMFVEGLSWATHAYVAGLKMSIRAGTFDTALVKPIDAQFTASFSRADPEDWARLVTAVAVFVVAVKNLAFTWDYLLVNMFFYLIMLFMAYIIVYSISLFIASLSIWFTDVRALFTVIDSITKMSSYPTDIYFPSAVRIIFSTILPIAFISTIPAKIFLFGPRLDLIAYSFIITIIFFIGSRKFFHYGLKHYSSASS